MQAPINKIIDFSTVDGPGCRTSIFFQACNIHCLYCHNPETQHLCNSCGACIKTCPKQALSFNEEKKVIWDEAKCIDCDQCIKTCENHASPKVRMMTPEEVMNRIRKNMPFIRGITTSGGECSLYPEFLTALFTLAKKEGLTTLMDSNGMISYAEHNALMKVTDGVMLDIKSWNSDVHQKLVESDNKIVKKNLRYLHASKKIEELRIVYVPGYVDAKTCLDGIKEILGSDIMTTRIKLITFRQNGVRSLLSTHPSPTRDEMNALRDYALSLGYKNIELR